MLPIDLGLLLHRPDLNGKAGKEDGWLWDHSAGTTHSDGHFYSYLEVAFFRGTKLLLDGIQQHNVEQP